MVEAKDVTVNVLTSAVTTLVIIFLLIPLLKIPVPAVREIETIETKKYYYPFWAGGWNLGTPIEKVILDNEQKTTTFTETGATGLLMGTVDLPAPKNQQVVGFIYSLSVETKYVGTAGEVSFSIWDGTDLTVIQGFPIPDVNYRFHSVYGVGASNFPIDRSQKGNTALELRVYLVGSDVSPDASQYCRNCVLTVVPLYES